MSAESIQITFLPEGITTEEVRSVLLSKLSEVFQPFEPTLNVRVYRDGKATSAVVTGFIYHFEKLVFKFRRVKFRSANSNLECTNVNIKADTGEIRQPNGKFFENRPPTFRRNFEKLCGVSPRKVLRIFNEELIKAVLPIFSGFQTVLYLKNLLPNEIRLAELQKPGYLCTFKPYENNSGVMLRYGSELETLQAIMFLNKNEAITVQAGVVHVQNHAGVRVDSCDYQCGLGKEGTCLNIENLALQYGYIPIDAFDPTILNKMYIQEVETSVTCKRCKSAYKILGVTVFLNSLVSRCTCVYQSGENIDADKKGISWDDENVTRLISGNNEYSTRLPGFCVQYPPVKRNYATTNEYCESVLPIMYEEWKTMSTRFKQDNQTRAIVEGHPRIIEGVDREDGKKSYAIKFNVPIKTKVWHPGNPCSVKRLTVEYKINENDRLRNKWKNMKLFKMVALSNGVQLHVRADLSAQIPPSKNATVIVIPKANKCEYIGLKAVLKSWCKDEDRYHKALTKIMLSPIQHEDNWLFPDNIPAIKHPYLYKLILPGIEKWKLSVCNSEQAKAVDIAINRSVSFIHGPPGTGKSFVLSVIVNMIIHREGGPILVTAPSNFAADSIAQAIVRNHYVHGNAPRVLRIYADSKEEYPCEPADHYHFNSAVLHEQVQRLEMWLKGSECDEFAKCVKSNNLVLLRNEQLNLYKLHKRAMEKSVMQEYNVFVMTVGALADKRVQAFSRNHKIVTVIVDECGQLPHAATLNLYGLEAKRYVFAGDPEQLPPILISQATDYSGYGLTVMDIVYMCASTVESSDRMSPPWTQLLEQHRMHPDIRTLVSKMTYHNKLRDGSHVLLLENEEFQFLCSTYAKRVVVFDHKFYEMKCGDSRKNEGEACIIVNAVKLFLSKGVQRSSIVILTLYEAQRCLIKKMLHEEKLDIVTLNVDAYQGREAPVIILSLTRANKTGDIGFASSQNRLNVALSRAMHHLFICCNLDFYERLRLQHWKVFCQVIRKECVVNKFMPC